jgi:hypothetical protein
MNRSWNMDQSLVLGIIAIIFCVGMAVGLLLAGLHPAY